LRPKIQNVFLKVTDDITLAQGPADATNRGLLILTNLLYVIPLLTVMRFQTEETA